ncbi:MAG: hypothetical protein HRU11_12805 [Parvularculaceae bacterium]|nr:hypothetical protein [Parvularculaceae bacterium]
MTDSTPTPAPGPSVAVAKGIALGLGVLLLGGTALLITLLVTRDSTSSVSQLPPVELQAGETITDVSLFENQAILLIERPDGSQVLAYINLQSGVRRDIDVTGQ